MLWPNAADTFHLIAHYVPLGLAKASKFQLRYVIHNITKLKITDIGAIIVNVCSLKRCSCRKFILLRKVYAFTWQCYYCKNQRPIVTVWKGCFGTDRRDMKKVAMELART